MTASSGNGSPTEEGRTRLVCGKENLLEPDGDAARVVEGCPARPESTVAHLIIGPRGELTEGIGKGGGIFRREQDAVLAVVENFART